MDESQQYTNLTIDNFEQISNFNSHVSEHIKNIYDKLYDLNNNSKVIADQTKEITTSTGNINESISGIAANADGQNQQMQNISKNLNELEDLIEDLTNLTKQSIHIKK